MKSILEYISKVLENQGIDCKQIPPSQEFPFECLSLDIGLDTKSRPRGLAIFCQALPLDFEGLDDAQTIEKALQDKHKEKHAEIFLHISTVLPFEVKEDAVGEVARLLLYFNNSLDLPGFGLDERLHRIFYRQSFLKPDGLISKKTLIAMIGLIAMTINSLSDTIEEVALGHKTMPQALSDNIRALTGIKP